MKNTIKFAIAGFFIAAFGLLAGSASANLANHLVISQAQTIGTTGSASDDFVELYNPTNLPVNLSGWSLQRRNLTGTLAKIDLSGIIPAQGFYLIVRGSATTGLTSLADKTFSLGIAFNNDDAFILANNTTTVSDINDPDMVDLMGTGSNTWFETSAAPNLNAGQVLLRKSGSSHTPNQGNGWDTNNNLSDFLISSPNPRNSFSPAEMPPAPPPVCPTGISAIVTPASIQTGQTATASAPMGWFGGSFLSDNTSIASVTNSTISGVGPGTASISGNAFNAPNGATGCNLSGTAITVVAPEPISLIDQLKVKLQTELNKLPGILSVIQLPQMPALPKLPELFN